MTDAIITGYWDFLWNGSQEIFYPTSLIHNIYHALFHLPDFQPPMLCISFMVILLIHILYGYFTDTYPWWLFYWYISFMVILLMHILYGYFADAYPLWLVYWYISFMVILLMHILFGYFTDAYPLWLFYWYISFMVILLMHILYGYFTDAQAFIPFLQIINITNCLHIPRDILFIIMGWNCQACNEHSLLWTFKYHTHEAIYSQAA